MMMNFILKSLEAFPTASFTESELVRISKSSFDALTKQKCLDRLKYDYMKEPYYSLALGDNGNERAIKKQNGRLCKRSLKRARIETRWALDEEIITSRGPVPKNPPAFRIN